MNDPAAADILRLEADWSAAMAANDADAIARFMADDWTIIGPDGSVSNKERFLALVRSGDLTHDGMDMSEATVRVHGDAAILMARGLSSGAYRGQKFRVAERVSDVWIRRNGTWRCVLTHLTRIPDA
jgi:ketosteroid isomerase-like protein